jgi:hypothetical protein
METYNQKYNSTKKGKAKRLFLNKRIECESKNIPFDLDEEWIIDRIKKGCDLTGMEFKLDSYHKPSSMSPSIDRIDPKGGYIKENCRVILHALNMFKGSENDTTMLDIANELSRIYKRKTFIIEFLDINSESDKNFDLLYHLKQFFTERQIEIIFKKFNQEKLTKTETEYYSRSIKKKLVAISNRRLHEKSRQILT